MTEQDTTDKTTKADKGTKGLHDAQAREVKVDDYPDRPYKEAMTDEQRDALDEAGLL